MINESDHFIDSLRWDGLDGPGWSRGCNGGAMWHDVGGVCMQDAGQLNFDQRDRLWN
jgi:hypothetical protein